MAEIDKGQFMVVSAVIVALITLALSTTIENVQSQTYEVKEMPKDINQLKQEAEKITADGELQEKEKENFRKMASYVDRYRVRAIFNEQQDCVTIDLQTTDQQIKTSCIS